MKLFDLRLGTFLMSRCYNRFAIKVCCHLFDTWPCPAQGLLSKESCQKQSSRNYAKQKDATENMSARFQIRTRQLSEDRHRKKSQKISSSNYIIPFFFLLLLKDNRTSWKLKRRNLFFLKRIKQKIAFQHKQGTELFATLQHNCFNQITVLYWRPKTKSIRRVPSLLGHLRGTHQRLAETEIVIHIFHK